MFNYHPKSDAYSNFDLSCLKSIFFTNERIDMSTLSWVKESVPKNVKIMDTWWQTETGAISFMTPSSETSLKGSCGIPLPGVQAEILDDLGRKVKFGTHGNICLKLPLPPGFTSTVWHNHNRYLRAYIKPFPGYYFTGDGGYVDADGFLYITGRLDDVINAGGHRISSGLLERAILTHHSISDVAIVGVKDPLKGRVPVAFVVLRNGYKIKPADLEYDLLKIVKDRIGEIATLKQVIVVKRLPVSTLDGKIMHRFIRMLCNEENVPIPLELDDNTIAEELKDSIKSNLNQFINQEYDPL